MSRELVAAASVMLTMVLVLLLKVSSWSYAMYSVMSLQGRLAAFCIGYISKIPWSYTAYDLMKVHSLCCKRNDDTGIFLVFLLVGS